MKKNDALSKFEANLFTLIKSYQNSNLISDSIVLEITNLYNNFKAKVTKNYDKHSRLIERIALRKNYALEESNKIIENLNNQYMLRVERIKKVHKNNIFNLNNEIYQLQQINKENLDKLNDDYQLKCQQIKANEDIIREALELNNNTLHANQAKVVKDYTVFLDQKAQETSQNIKKIHAYYSRQIMLTGEEDSAKLLDIDSQIEELEKKLTQINKDYVQQKSKIELNKLEATTDLNNEIRMKTKTKNYRLHQEKENNIIKQKDIKKQLDYFEEQYSEKIDKIMDDFVAELNQYDELDAINETDYKTNLERIKRNYFYNFYYLNSELNNYLKTVSDETQETLKLRLVNKKLIKLKTKSYYQKIKELKENYQLEVDILTDKYEQTASRNKLAKSIAEINKNYELEVAHVELNTIKANNQLLSAYIAKQVDINTQNIDNDFEYNARTLRNTNNEKLESFNKELAIHEASMQIRLNEVKNQIANLKALKVYISSSMKLKENFLNDSSLRAEKLEQIISNLELDRNAKIKEYNAKQLKAKINIIENYAELEFEELAEKLDYEATKLKLEKKLTNMLFYKQRQPLASKIDLNKLKEKYENNYEHIYYEKNYGLANLTKNRRNYRSDTWQLGQNGVYTFTILQLLLSFFYGVQNILHTKLKTNNTGYYNFFSNFSKMLFQLFEDILKDFNIQEIIIIEERIQTETKNTYKEKENNLVIEYNNNKYLLQKQINSFNNTLALYDDTLLKYRTNIIDLNKKHKSVGENNSFFDNMFSYNVLNIKNEIKANKNSIYEIKKRKKALTKMLKNTQNKLLRLDESHQRNLQKNDLYLKRDYASSYALVEKANTLIKRNFTKLKKIEQHYLKPKNIDKLINSTAMFVQIANILKYLRSTYSDFFDLYKTDNEKKYQNIQKSIITKFNTDLKRAINKSQKSLLNHKIITNKTENKINSIIQLTKNELANAYSLYQSNLANLKASYQKNIQKENDYLSVIRQTYTTILYSITDNISYLRANYIRQNKIANKEYQNNLLLINRNYKKEVKNNNLTLNNYKIRLNFDIKNITSNIEKNISEIKMQQKEYKSSYQEVRNKNNFLKKEIKHNYQKERIANIANSTAKLLKEKLAQNDNIKKIKKQASRTDSKLKKKPE